MDLPMNSLRSLSRVDLLAATFQLANDERRITLSVLEHFREVERRKAYSDLDYKSLYEYAISHLKYSEGSASRRIAAMYALKENPELGERIQSGETSVTSVARIHTTIRRDEKLTSRKWRPEEKKALYGEMAALPMRALEKGLTELAPAAALNERIRPVTGDLHEVKIYLTSEELKSLEELRGVLGHSIKNPGSNSELFRKLIALASEGVKKKRNAKDRIVKKNPRVKTAPISAESKCIPALRSASPSRDRVTAPHRREVFTRAGHHCEYRSPSGNKCDSNFKLEIEHRIPRALGGSNDPSNLEILCRDHNQIRGIQVFGPDQMGRD
jgi:5-methylcytosine-specific restriction endonuclease McrA